ncbi:hypothetical protein QY95_03637 [Bacillus thermotolerans]|uniref:Uncharacterized protein n=1 Tax=Bacillus thermotolerans TaxID=1221996 RepID=A0A0F5HP39_BACTR|nr:hypothetical protein QY95_03637 [Bacillus thermotolerans]
MSGYVCVNHLEACLFHYYFSIFMKNVQKIDDYLMEGGVNEENSYIL